MYAQQIQNKRSALVYMCVCVCVCRFVVKQHDGSAHGGYSEQAANQQLLEPLEQAQDTTHQQVSEPCAQFSSFYPHVACHVA